MTSDEQFEAWYRTAYAGQTNYLYDVLTIEVARAAWKAGREQAARDIDAMFRTRVRDDE